MARERALATKLTDEEVKYKIAVAKEGLDETLPQAQRKVASRLNGTEMAPSSVTPLTNGSSGGSSRNSPRPLSGTNSSCASFRAPMSDTTLIRGNDYFDQQADPDSCCSMCASDKVHRLRNSWCPMPNEERNAENRQEAWARELHS